MAKFKINRNKNYTTMSNYHLKDKRLSLKAKGLLSMMLSLPDDWNYSINGLVAISKENETSIKSGLDELKEYGYLIIEKILPNQTQSKKIEYVYNIYEKPNQDSDNQEVENQGVGFLGVDFLGVENQGQLNTNNKETNNKIINNKINIINNIVEYLNQKTNSNYKSSTKKTQDLIKARLNEGFSEEDFKKVIDLKCDEWSDNEMSVYLRPETLFGNKFEGYLNQKQAFKRKKVESYEEMMEKWLNE